MKMALKSLVFVLLLAAGHGHVGAGVGRVEVREAEAQLSNIFGSLYSVRIGGILFCTPNGNILMGVNATATPVFPSKYKVLIHPSISTYTACIHV